VGVGSSGGAEVGVGSAGRGVSVGGGDVGRGVGGDVGRAVGGTWVADGCAVGASVGASVGGMTDGLISGLRVGVLVAGENVVGRLDAGVRITVVGVRSVGTFVCAASMVTSGVRDKTAAEILLLNKPRGSEYAAQRPGPISPSLYAWITFASSNPRSCP